MVLDGQDWKAAIAAHRKAPNDAIIRMNLRRWQAAGMTYLREGGDRWGVGARARELAPEYGIRLVTPLSPLCKAGHYGSFIGTAFETPRQYAALVEKQKKDGADFIKIMISGLMDFDRFGVLTQEGLEPALIQELVHIAHEEGLAVMAHANGDEAVRAALAGGVDSIEHGAYLTDETLCQLAESRAVWVPTLVTIGNLIGCGRFPDEVLKPLLAYQRNAVKKAAALGAKIACGSDAGAYRVLHGQGGMDERVCRLLGIPAPEADVDAPFQMLVSAIDYNEYVGRMAIGRIERGTLKQNQEIMVCNYHDPDAAPKKAKAVSMYEFEGLGKNPVTESTAGNIICLSGIGDITIGDTICAPECVEPLPFVKISAPTMEMTFSINDSPYAGREGKFVTSRQLRDRLFRETLKDVSLRVTELEGSTDAFNVAGRGEMSLSILIETMRREGYEFQVSPPRVLYQMIDGKKCEPIERLVCDVPQEYVGAVIEKLGSRKGDLAEMTPIGSRMKLEFLIPARGLFGYRNEFLTDTKGEGIMASVFDSYAPYKGELARRNTGSLVASETGTSITYGLFNAQERGVLFIGAGVDVYEGMVVGQSPKQEDITVNVCKKKQLTNMRASGSDDALRLVPPKQMSLEQCLEFLADDELLEVTPKNLRIRKTILNKELRMKATHGNKKILQ